MRERIQELDNPLPRHCRHTQTVCVRVCVIKEVALSLDHGSFIVYHSEGDMGREGQ